MEHSIEITPIDDQIPQLPQTEKDEIIGRISEICLGEASYQIPASMDLLNLEREAPSTVQEGAAEPEWASAYVTRRTRKGIRAAFKRIEEGRKVDHLIEIKQTNGRDPSGSQTEKSVNQIFDEMFEDLENSSIKSCTIFKVNVGLRESNPDAYTPKMVSIGPYHKKNPQLWPMKKYKLLYLRRFLKRGEVLDAESCMSEYEKFLKRREGLDVESCMSELEKLKEKAIKCYEDLDNDSCSSGQFLQMLLLDGCFVVEFIREQTGKCPEGEDRIINVGCVFDLISRDLMLLENQLPFFVLTKLHDMTRQDGELPFAILAKYTFPINFPKFAPAALLEIHDKANAGKIKHLLHLIHMSWQGNPGIDPAYYGKSLCCNPLKLCRSKEKPKDKEDKVIPNVTELSEAGVDFMKVGNIYRSPEKDDTGDTSLFEIKFENGLIKIPCLQVYDSTESNLRNLIAFEQHSDDVQHKYFSDFAVIMDHLIESDKDVNLLRQKGIIGTRIGEDKEVTRIFNQIGKGVCVSDELFDREEYRKAIQHCEIPWNRMKANLKRNYFSSPWVGASTVAAIILLVLTTIQTVLAFTDSVK